MLKDQPEENGYPAPPAGAAPPPGISPSPHASPSPVPTDISATASANGQQQPGQAALEQQTPQALPQQQFAEFAESSRASYRLAPGKEQGVLENLMESFQSAKDQAERRVNDPSELSNALESSFQNVPAQLDAEP